MPTSRPLASDPSTWVDPPSERPAPLPAEPRGGTLGRYVLLDVLGRGGMGLVYVAFDPQLDRKIAIKVLWRRADDASREAHERLLREAQAMAKLSHPNVVAVHDVGTFEDGVFVAMDLVEGTTLRGWLAEGPRTWSERLEVMRAAGRGLAAAHAAGIVHRDFKPDNVLVGRDGSVRVTDFGIARAAREPAEGRPSGAPRGAPPGGSEPHAAFDTPLTMTGSVLGTVGYMAPEQAHGDVADARSDQFSFCVTLYGALYEVRPFAADDLETYATAVEKPPRPPPADSRVPSWLQRVVARGLAADPDARYPSMEALLRALERNPAVPRRRWVGAAIGVAAVVAAVAGLRLSVQRRVSACRATPSLAGAWDDEVRRDALAAFVATGAPDAREDFDRTAKVLDAYTSGWRDAYSDACEAARVHHVQTEAVYGLRAACFERQRAELQALTSLLRRADAPLVDASIKAAYGLPSLSWCSDVEQLQANAGLPDDPDKRARVEQAWTELAQAGALTLGDRNREALAAAQQALASARAAGHRSTEAEALLLVGNAQTRLVDEVSAERSLADAAWAGLESGHLAVVVRASAIEAYITGVELQRREEAEDWLARADAALQRMGGNDELDAFVASRRGAVLQSLDRRPELALPYVEHAVRAYRRLFGVHPYTEHELLGLGDVFEALGRSDIALANYAESLAMAETLYGPDSLRTGVSAAHVGDAYLKVGHLEQGTRLLQRALAIFERRDNVFWTVAALQVLTRGAILEHDPSRALALGQRGLAMLDRPESPPVLVPASCVGTGEALVALARPSEALPLCDRALAAQQAVKALDPDKVYEWDALRCRGEALLALHDPRSAVAPLERSIDMPRREWPGDLARARFALARALAQSNGDAKRARALAEQARDELAPRAELGSEAAAVTAWLDAHGGS